MIRTRRDVNKKKKWILDDSGETNGYRKTNSAKKKKKNLIEIDLQNLATETAFDPCKSYPL